jgi:hypothetical protein
MKRQNGYPWHTYTWPLTFLSWNRHFNSKWLGLTSKTQISVIIRSITGKNKISANSTVYFMTVMLYLLFSSTTLINQLYMRAAIINHVYQPVIYEGCHYQPRWSTSYIWGLPLSTTLINQLYMRAAIINNADQPVIYEGCHFPNTWKTSWMTDYPFFH